MASEIGIILGAIRRKNVNRAFHILHCLIGNFTVRALFGLGLNFSLFFCLSWTIYKIADRAFYLPMDDIKLIFKAEYSKN